MHYNSVQCTTIHCNALQFTAMHYSSVQCTTVQCNAVAHNKEVISQECQTNNIFCYLTKLNNRRGHRLSMSPQLPFDRNIFPFPHYSKQRELISSILTAWKNILFIPKLHFYLNSFLLIKLLCFSVLERRFIN